MLRRASISQSIAAALILTFAIVTVGLTASADDPFTISVRPVLLRLGIDLDVKLGSLHLHASWSALPTTNDTAPRF